MTGMESDPDAVPEQVPVVGIGPPLARLEAELARNRAELTRYRELIAALPSIYEGKFGYQRRMLRRELSELMEEQERLRLSVRGALHAAAQQQQLPPAAASAAERAADSAADSAAAQLPRLRSRQRQLRRRLKHWQGRLRRLDLTSRVSSRLQHLQESLKRLLLRLRLLLWLLLRQGLRLRVRLRQRLRRRQVVLRRQNARRLLALESASRQSEPPEPPELEDSNRWELTPHPEEPRFDPAPASEWRPSVFEQALETLLATAPPLAYPRARELYFRKFSLEHNLGSDHPADGLGNISTFVRMAARQSSTEGGAESPVDPATGAPADAANAEPPEPVLEGFSVVNWDDHPTDLDGFADYLARRWNLHPSTLEPNHETWFRGSGQVANFKLPEMAIRPSPQCEGQEQ